MAETTDLKWELYEIWMHIKWVSNHLCRLSSSINKQSLSPTALFFALSLLSRPWQELSQQVTT